MELIFLKVPPERIELMANAIESHVMAGDAQHNTQQLNEIITYLRWRLAKWEAAHPSQTAA